MRIAWAAHAVEQCTACFSEHIVRTFRQGEALACAWSLALGTDDDPEARRRLMNAIADLADEDTEYEYGEVAASLALLEEVDRDDGLGASTAADYAAMGFASAQFYREGIHSGDPLVSDVEFKARQVPFWEMARRAYDRARSTPLTALTRDLFRDIRVEGCLEPVSPDLIRRAMIKAPSPEVRRPDTAPGS
jgi:hypothetical protein